MTPLKLFVVGYPGDLGGADTELWHVLRLWTDHGVDVTLIPTHPPAAQWKHRCAQIGAQTYQLTSPNAVREIPGIVGRIVVSFCNSHFLKYAYLYRALGCRVIWVNCMTWMFPQEAHLYRHHGPMDAYVFQSRYQQSLLMPLLAPLGVTADRCHLIRGAFFADEFPYAPLGRRAGEPYVVGRLARGDTDKWHHRTWQMLERVGLEELRARVMGWTTQIGRKLGTPPPWAKALHPCAETSRQFLASLHAYFAMNGGARENWPRVGLEAMAVGVPLVVDDAWGWREMVEHRQTGFLAGDTDQFAAHLRELAEDDSLRLRIARRARERLLDELAPPETIWLAWKQLFDSLEVNAAGAGS